MKTKSNKGYSSFEEWKIDQQLVIDSPNDAQLMDAVVKRSKESSYEIRRQIHEFLLDETFAKNPVSIMEQMVRDNPELMAIINTKENPWFEV